MKKFIRYDHETILLPDDRQLGYSVYGAVNGKPVLFFHGIPGSRLQRNPNSSFLEKYSMLVYALDRPGIGLSTFQKHRQLLDWPTDVSYFCEKQHIEKCDVIGVSGGAPYALACAYKLPEIITTVTMVSSLPPIYSGEFFRLLEPRMRLLFTSAQKNPLILIAALNILFNTLNIRVKNAFHFLINKLPVDDQKLFMQPEIADMFENDVAQAFRQGSYGVVQDLRILSEPWGIPLEEIKQTVHVWHGMADTTIPVSTVGLLAKKLKNSKKHFIENAGHFFTVKSTSEIFLSILDNRTAFI